MPKLPNQFIEKKIKECVDVSLSAEQQSSMKRNLMASIRAKKADESFAFAPLIAAIKKIAVQISPSEYFRVLLKEKLITLAEYGKQNLLKTRLFGFLSLRKVAVATVALLFIFTILPNLILPVERAEASLLTTLQEVTGEVTILRGDNEISGTPGLLLKIDDVIRTGAASRAVISFPDQSVSRLSENTEMKISTLFINPDNKTETIVELVLNRGRMWTRVVNLIDNISRFQVKAKNTVVVAKYKAAFDIEVLPKDKARVSAVQNKVDIVVTTPQEVVETTLVKGFSAEVKNGLSVVSTIVPANDEVKQDQWVQDNLAQDKAYIDNVKQETEQSLREQANVLPDNPLYMVKEITETTKLALTFDEFARQERILESTMEKLGAAEVSIERSKFIQANALLIEFKSAIQEIIKLMNEYGDKDPVAVLDFMAKLKDRLSMYQKQLAVILPTDRLYPIKEVVGQALIMIAPSQMEKTQEKLSQAGEKLLEAHDLIEQGNPLAAKEQVQAYGKSISEVVSEVKQLPIDQKEKAVNILLDTKAEDIKSLESINSTILAGTSSFVGTSTEIKQAVSDVQAVIDAQKDQPKDYLHPSADVGSSSTMLPTIDLEIPVLLPAQP